jgi:RING finger protein 113A
MHDRGDYKAGWQIEREWDEEQKRKQAALARGETLDSDESGGEYVLGT